MLVYALACACVWVTNMQTLVGRGFLHEPLARTVYIPSHSIFVHLSSASLALSDLLSRVVSTARHHCLIQCLSVCICVCVYRVKLRCETNVPFPKQMFRFTNKIFQTGNECVVSETENSSNINKKFSRKKTIKLK